MDNSRMGEHSLVIKIPKRLLSYLIFFVDLNLPSIVNIIIQILFKFIETVRFFYQ